MTDNNSVDRRRFLQATGGAATAAALAGCLGGGGEETDTETDMDDEEDMSTDTTSDGDSEPQGNDRTLQLINSTITTFDPIKATDTASGAIIQNVFDALMNYPNGQVATETLLAESVDVSDDFTTYTFKLKEGVEYHGDYGEVTAEDVVYSFERLAASDNSRRAYFILAYAMNVAHETDDEGAYVPGSLQMAATGDYEFTMRLAEPFAPTMEMIAYTSFSVLPKGILGDIDTMPAGGLDSDETESIGSGDVEHEEFATNNPVGAGPYVFDHWETSQEAEIVRNDNYHGGEVLNGGVFWKVIPKPETAYQYAQNQNSDLISMPTSKYDPGKVNVEGTDDLGRQYGTYGPMDNGVTANYLSVATINSFYIGFNCESVPKPVRQAVAYVSNQKEGVDQVFKGRGLAAHHLTPPNIYPGGAPEYTSHAEENYPYGYNSTNIDDAKSVMEDAGYGPDNRYEVTFTTYQSPTWQGLGKLLRDKLASAHVNMQLEEAPFSTLLERGRNGNLEAYSLGWVMDWPRPNNFLGQAVPELTNTDVEGGADGFYLDWDGDDDGMTDAAMQASEAWSTIQNNPAPTEEAQAARDEAYVQMEEAMWEDMVLLPMYHRTDERMWYDWVDIPRFGGGGASRQKNWKVVVNERDN
jgi:peptide/nickel transport system substrate-binding protein